MQVSAAAGIQQVLRVDDGVSVTRVEAMVTAIVCATGMAGLLAMTRWGIGTSPDSVHYVEAARQFLGGHGGRVVAGTPGVSAQFAPLYPLLLAAIGWLGADPLDAARWLNTLLFGVNILLVGYLVRRSARNTRWLSIIGSVLMVGSLPALSAHAAALSEPLFLAFTLLGFFALARYVESSRSIHLVGASALVGMAMLTRYAGAACLITGVLAMLVQRAPLGRRLRDAAVFGVVASLPFTLWILRNLSVSGSATNREFFFHPIGRRHAWQALYTASSWVLIPESAPDALRLGFWLLAALVAVLVVVNRRSSGHPAPAVISLLTLFVAVYTAFLAVSISILDANTPLDNRILLPVFTAGVIVALHALDDAWPAVRRRPAATAIAATTIVVFAAAHVVRGVDVASTGYADGWGLSSLAWQQSPTVARVRAFPAGTRIYSNAPEIVYLHTGRKALALPRRSYPMTQQSNPRYVEDLAAFGRDVRATCAVVVYFNRVAETRSLPTEQELAGVLALQRVASAADGTILGPDTCRK